MAPTNHDELRALVAAHGLPEELASRAVWGIALLPGGTGRSRLGGRPEITDAWPMNNGCGLTHLASIALDELPDVPDRAHLPREGTLVFFADFSLENEGWGSADGREPVMELMYITPGAHTELAVPPEEPRGRYDVPVVLNERRVRFESVLTLPCLEDTDDEFDEAYWHFVGELGSPDHLLLGEPAYLQADPREPGELSLLQLNWDEELRFVYGDGGQISFYGHPDDLRAGRWQRIKATPDSA